MRLTVDDKTSLKQFLALFQLLKKWSANITLKFEPTRLTIQCMDKSHVCLADISINSSWFKEYECQQETMITVISTHLADILTALSKEPKEKEKEKEKDSDKSLELVYDESINSDKLYLNSLSQSCERHFELMLVECEDNALTIPEVEYDVELLISAKEIAAHLHDLQATGPNLTLKCEEDFIHLKAEGDYSSMHVKLNTDALEEYSITEDYNSEIQFSLEHLCSMCLTTNITNQVSIALSDEFPMRLKYHLGNENGISQGYIAFYLAPKIAD